ncbi:putative colanic acid biosynthesis acetyltransferase [Rhodoblastus acidophilus]|uniref:Colanic acid biosynthesis acetyltransferase n=1 Tax=Candidatus Rhodoblastus alkanivorans TaxID=2954117 RepID=A0ABS9Z6P1_9HYPH|nr:putative colanic acid biosynthesis acetyltransferase [Candidatus Rhodoblastus alkanivorans]MCI4679532.1 putative colanic acid biosynthesis acetyltransferase [Candidatus Rhodoblastus alkanivorans]MCI4683283.1 putative colanic acid biosynthesis acetyltransferase [Candidatus Rhodoblastus alkanivorans]MDI4640595.1 putative colanic acid biosynthesis acetyltransferase [Rhodoblastus acidophilus]
MMEPKRRSPRHGGPTFALRHRLFRCLWGLVWNGLGAWTPTPFFLWRRALVRLFGGKITASARIYPGVQIWYPPHLEMAEYSCLARGVNCYCMAPIRLEPYALASQGAHLCAGTHDVDDPHFTLHARPIVIAAHAWVAAEAFVGPGVTLAAGAVLGARAVAFRDLESWTIYVGNPARRSRARRRPLRKQAGLKP